MNSKVNKQIKKRTERKKLLEPDLGNKTQLATRIKPLGPFKKRE